MPGWQIALIAIGAALLAASAAAGIIAKRGGRPVWRPRAKMSALGTASGSARNIPSHRTVTSRSANPASYAPTAPAPPTSGPRHRGRTPGPGQTGDHPCPRAFPPGTLPAGSSATGRRATVPARRGPFFRNRRARFFMLALPVLFLVIFASVFTGTKVAGGSIDTSLYYVPGIITLTIISAAFGNLGPRPGPLLLHT
jgi:hypothetical protein